MTKQKESTPSILTNVLARRLFLRVLAFAALLVVLLTLIYGVVTYYHETEEMERRFVEIQQSYLDVVQSAWWVTDMEQLQRALDGICRVPGIAYAAAVSEEGVVREAGSEEAGGEPSRRFSVKYVYNDNPHLLGDLYIAADADYVRRHIVSHVLGVVATQAATVVLVSLMLFFLVYRTIVGRLVTITNYARGLSPNSLDKPLVMDQGYGKAPSPKDELDELGDTMNTMRQNLYAAFAHQKKTEAELQRHRDYLEDIVSQRTAEIKGKNDEMAGLLAEQKKTAEKLRKSEEQYRLIFEFVPIGLLHFDVNGVIAACNDHFVNIIGSSREAIIGLDMLCLPDENLGAAVETSLDGGSGSYEGVYRSVTGKKDSPVKAFFVPMKFSEGIHHGGVGIVEDITERKQAEAERDELQAQLHHSQKMESIGRLAGGVAHDFNNMLSIINGYAELMADVLSPSDALYENVREIQDAGKRSAGIVRKLLAFARKQTIAPVLMNLNESVSGMLAMLERLIGENIELHWKPEKNLWMVKMDMSQLDQILVNLAVNAKDAIRDAGKITIETQNIEFDEEYCAHHMGFVAGEFVLVAVSDNGCGMDDEIMGNLFEPFFTTKDVGEGTGLGLPTVYGIVKQNNGFVNVYSEPGKGTTFKIYLPRVLAENDAGGDEKHAEYLPGKGETIMVLEDEVTVLNLTRVMLERLGYNVLTANSTREALDLAHANDGMIHLLITDVIMPDINGRDFANQLKKSYPHIKTLFMSGYTANVIAHHGILDEGLAFLQKPFSIKDLAVKIREAMDG